MIEEFILLTAGVCLEIVTLKAVDTNQTLSCWIVTISVIVRIRRACGSHVGTGCHSLRHDIATVHGIFKVECLLTRDHARCAIDDTRRCDIWCSSQLIRASNAWINCSKSPSVGGGITYCVLAATLGQVENPRGVSTTHHSVIASLVTANVKRYVVGWRPAQ